MKTILKVTALFLLYVLFPNHSSSQDYPMPIDHFRLVNDFTEMLSYDQLDMLEIKHGLFYDTTGIMVVITIVDDLKGMSLKEYSEGFYNAWSLETLDENEAVLMMVYGQRDGAAPEMHIHTQGKYRDIISPSVARLIVSTDANRWFKGGNNFAAINSASNSVTLLLSEQITPAQFKRQRGGLLRGSPALLIILVVAVIALGTRSFLIKKREQNRNEVEDRVEEQPRKGE